MGGSGHSFLSTMTTPENDEGNAGKALASHDSLNRSLGKNSVGESTFTSRASLRRDTSSLRGVAMPIEQVEECAAVSWFLDCSTSWPSGDVQGLMLRIRYLALCFKCHTGIYQFYRLEFVHHVKGSSLSWVGSSCTVLMAKLDGAIGCCNRAL